MTKTMLGSRNRRSTTSPENDRRGRSASHICAPQSNLTEILARCQETSRHVVEDAITELSRQADDKASNDLIAAALYFERVGDVDRAVDICRLTLSRVIHSNDRYLIRKVHNVAAVIFARTCDFEKAFNHLAEALELSRSQGSELQLRILCNAVSILQSAGLVQDAKNLALSLEEQICESSGHSEMVLQNSLNGAYISRTTQDHVSFIKFYDTARKAIENAPTTTKIQEAIFYAIHAFSLELAGHAAAANTYLQEKIACRTDPNNFHVNCVLYLAFAECAVISGNEESILLSREGLIQLLGDSHKHLMHRESILRALLASIYSSRSGIAGAKYAELARQLGSLMVDVKYKQFFDRVRREADDANSVPQLRPPGFCLPQALVSSPSVFQPSNVYQNEVSVSEVGIPVPLIKASSVPGDGEQYVKTPLHMLAEDWAVAAEFASGGDGRSGFRVGRVAGTLAEALDFPSERVAVIELACRLRNIGMITFDTSVSRPESLEELGVVFLQQHCLLGSKMLSALGDPVLKIAADVARFHHAWWNGCGWPEGWEGESIPIEARICAVAETYCDHRYCSKSSVVWSHEKISHQVLAMAGVQLDPMLVEAFASVPVSKLDVDDIFIVGDRKLTGDGSRLGNSRTTLARSLSASIQIH